jgi:predicted nucleotidyltransferase
MAPLTDELIQEMTDAIVREVDPERIILFGSRARDEAGADSDIDLLIVESEPFGPNRSRHQEITRLYRALSQFGIAKDILVYSTDEVTKWQHSINHIISHSLQEGKVLYERS